MHVQIFIPHILSPHFLVYFAFAPKLINYPMNLAMLPQYLFDQVPISIWSEHISPVHLKKDIISLPVNSKNYTKKRIHRGSKFAKPASTRTLLTKIFPHFLQLNCKFSTLTHRVKSKNMRVNGKGNLRKGRLGRKDDLRLTESMGVNERQNLVRLLPRRRHPVEGWHMVERAVLHSWGAVFSRRGGSRLWGRHFERHKKLCG